MIVLLNGCINSGKSSTARALASLLPKAAHVELDDLRHCPAFGRVLDNTRLTADETAREILTLV